MWRDVTVQPVSRCHLNAAAEKVSTYDTCGKEGYTQSKVHVECIEADSSPLTPIGMIGQSIGHGCTRYRHYAGGNGRAPGNAANGGHGSRKSPATRHCETHDHPFQNQILREIAAPVLIPLLARKAESVFHPATHRCSGPVPQVVFHGTEKVFNIGPER